MEQDCILYLKALADESRWRLVKELLESSGPVSELAQRTELSEYNVSKHLRILREAGIVRMTKEGRIHHYEVTPEFLERLSVNRSQLNLGCCVFKFDE